MLSKVQQNKTKKASIWIGVTRGLFSLGVLNIRKICARRTRMDKNMEEKAKRKVKEHITPSSLWRRSFATRGKYASWSKAKEIPKLENHLH